MRNFLVNVNGTTYEIGVEEIEGKAAPTAKLAEPAVSAPVKHAKSGVKTINAPMPGNILSVNTKPGDAVKAGQVLMILEAMKMENEILAPVDGTVGEVFVQKSSVVETGTPLCSIQ